MAYSIYRSRTWWIDDLPPFYGQWCPIPSAAGRVIMLGGNVSRDQSWQPGYVVVTYSGWWLGHPSDKYEFVNWDDDRNPILMGKCQKWQPNHQPVVVTIYLRSIHSKNIANITWIPSRQVSILIDRNSLEPVVHITVPPSTTANSSPWPQVKSVNRNSKDNWLVVWTPLKNMKVNWDD